MIEKDFEFVLSKRHRNSLMGLSIVWVTLHHFALYSPTHSSVFTLFSQGSAGVDVFFFLSVFGLCYSYSANGLREYYTRRIQRILPMYFFFIAFWYLGCKIFHIPIENIGLMIFDTITCASCVFNMRTGIDIIEWYIPAQFFIYIIFPIMFIGMKKTASLKTYSLVVVFIVVVLAGLIISNFSSRPIFLRLPVLFIGTLTYFAIISGEAVRKPIRIANS